MAVTSREQPSPVFTGEYRHTVDDKGRLAIPTRLRAQLAEGGTVTASGMAAELPMSRQAVAKHLGLLETAGLVSGERQRSDGGSRGRGQASRQDLGLELKSAVEQFREQVQNLE